MDGEEVREMGYYTTQLVVQSRWRDRATGVTFDGVGLSVATTVTYRAGRSPPV